jgi:hypothetical protein
MCPEVFLTSICDQNVFISQPTLANIERFTAVNFLSDHITTDQRSSIVRLINFQVILSNVKNSIVVLQAVVLKLI